MPTLEIRIHGKSIFVKGGDDLLLDINETVEFKKKIGQFIQVFNHYVTISEKNQKVKNDKFWTERERDQKIHEKKLKKNPLPQKPPLFEKNELAYQEYKDLCLKNKLKGEKNGKKEDSRSDD